MPAIDKRIRRSIIISAQYVSVFICSMVLGTASAEKMSSLLPGDPSMGGEVFFNKGCSQCHAILGEGGLTAPDLAHTPSGHLNAAQISAAMWNHAPQMWERIKVEHLSVPNLKEKEVADLFAFLYAIRYFDEPGNPERGRELLDKKGCIQCHSLRGEGGKIAPDLARWGSFANPILWAQIMWNKAPVMENAMKDKGLAWPEFEGSEMIDLLAYIRKVSASSYEQQIFLLPADPTAGESLFESKGCVKCHAVSGKGGNTAIDFGQRVDFPRTLTQLAGRMWSHSPNMWDEMRKEGIARPEFSGREMADLIVYLYAVQYVDQPGDAKSGEKLFTDKHCAFCHSKGESSASKKDLEKWKGKVTPVFMAYALWSHGPSMYERMQQFNLEWPVFEGNQISDLLEYLNQ